MGTGKESLDEVSQSDLGGKIKEGVEEASKTAELAAKLLSEGGEKLDWTGAFKAACQGVESIQQKMDLSVPGQTRPTCGRREVQGRGSV